MHPLTDLSFLQDDVHPAYVQSTLSPRIQPRSLQLCRSCGNDNGIAVLASPCSSTAMGHTDDETIQSSEEYLDLCRAARTFIDAMAARDYVNARGNTAPAVEADAVRLTVTTSVSQAHAPNSVDTLADTKKYVQPRAICSNGHWPPTPDSRATKATRKHNMSDSLSPARVE